MEQTLALDCSEIASAYFSLICFLLGQKWFVLSRRLKNDQCQDLLRPSLATHSLVFMTLQGKQITKAVI